MRIEITIRHTAAERDRAKRELNGLLDELGQLCEVTDTKLMEDDAIETQPWLRASAATQSLDPIVEQRLDNCF